MLARCSRRAVTIAAPTRWNSACGTRPASIPSARIGTRRPVPAWGATLNTASGLGAYTLTDRATWLAFANKDDLEIAVEGDARLFNQYGIILVNSEKHPPCKSRTRSDLHRLGAVAGRPERYRRLRHRRQAGLFRQRDPDELERIAIILVRADSPNLIASPSDSIRSGSALGGGESYTQLTRSPARS